MFLELLLEDRRMGS